MRLAPEGKGAWAKALLRIAGFFGTILLGIYFYGLWITTMPGDSWAGPLPPATSAEEAASKHTKATVKMLAQTIGPRDREVNPKALERTAVFVTETLTNYGYTVKSLPYQTRAGTVRNLEAVLPGSGASKEVIVVGAHYDSVPTTPGADDNASGVAAMLEIARQLKGKQFAREIRFVGFVNEEPPNFQEDSMGSLVYAKYLKTKGVQVAAMFSLETMGYFDATPGGQQYPPPLNWFYPDTGDFIAIVSNTANGGLTRKVVALFREVATVPSEGATVPGFLPGVDYSDHWAFWQAGYPGVMVSDTAFFRNNRYHEPSDTAETLDYDRLGRVAVGLASVIAKLAADGVD